MKDHASGTEQRAGIRLSICIPTYNRAAFIGATLESVAAQATDGVEVVIVDGASTDNTEEIVASFEDRLPSLTFHRAAVNGGVDKDMATCVDLARGEYCWLMSSDDVFAQGALSTMLRALRSGADIYLCDITLCDFSLRPVRNSRFLSRRRTTERFRLSDRAQLLSYLAVATSNNALFCYMSSVAFRRDMWMVTGHDSRFSGTGYAHVFSLFSSIMKGGVLEYVPVPLVLNRADNDSFSGQGIEKRYMMDFDGYQLLADGLFKDDPQVRQAFLRVMTREHPWYRLAKLRSSVASAARWKEIHERLSAFGYSRWALALADLFGRSSFFVRAALYVNERFARSALLRWLRTPV